MPRILDDPTQAVCPSFESADWNFLVQSMIDAHQGPPPLTQDEATQRLKDTWARENATKIAAWNVQAEQDQAEKDELDRLAQEEVDAQLAQCLKEAEEQRKEVERKKPKLNSFDPDRVIGDSIEPRPAPYAVNKLNNLEYIELDFFTTKGCKEASADTGRSISHDTLAFAQLEDTITVRPLAAVRSSKNIRNDEDLSWEEMLQAKNTMLRLMAKSATWSATHAQALAAFFIALELHPRVQQLNGKRTLLLYQSHVRREWFEALKRDEGFNIEHIGEPLLRSFAEEIDRKVQREEFDQVRTTAPISFFITHTNRTPPPPFFPQFSFPPQTPPPQISTPFPLTPALPFATRHLPFCHATPLPACLP
ncbi:hypothetical protein EDB85DRAFT_1877935 [Lactarius pseudohatsudake]|nr:hypothetical protein EDB85DRAFT_1877935 [Lactarius pseudohatsudake]